jgi:hypothetical protein
MEVTEPPKVLFAQISAIMNRFNNNGKIRVTDDSLIVMVHEVSPLEYAPVLSGLEISKGSMMTLNDVQTAMRTH